jgi:mRNA-degrading endonuclease RelE of RelBE toxin-antitoxin system
MRVFDAVLHYARTGAGDITSLRGKLAGAFHLRAGDYRVLFTLEQQSIVVFAVRHRSEAYRNE